MRWSMVDTFTTDIGGLDFQRSQHGSGMSSKNQAKRFVSVLQRQADHKGSSMFSVDEMKETAARNNIVVKDFFTFLSSLNDHGFLIKKGKNQYQLLSVDY
ncbi:hypothetical protein LSTR_LSTR001346 [Laodelphax striatellus]|uniref:MCM8/REC winged helix domain-containing protein n=1 Tax=Laodelphax striatellus TaxID=195883 RepID=A0A482XGY3_LAOST|nr:hypothetical protein LSTR_LSTR001346 [Laodelphax striatellus]